MGAETHEWSYDMFKKGCGAIGADNIANWIGKVPAWQQKMGKDEAFYAKVYEQAFIISQEPGFKNISNEIAIALWQLFLPNKCKFLDKWCQFIETSNDHAIIKKDEWNMFYDINKKTGGDFDNFPDIDDGTWPTIIDEF